VNQDASTDARTRPTSTVATLRWIALIALIVATVGGAFAYWRYSELYPTTENAYVGTEMLRVAAEVSGPVSHVYVQTDEKVREDDPLFDIDPTLYDAQLRNARAQFDAAAAAAGTAADALKDSANKFEDKRKALENAIAAYRKTKDAPAPDQPPTTDLASAERGWLDALKAYREAAEDFSKEQDKSLTVTTPTVQLRAAAAQLQKAMHDRVKTHVMAPADGYVSNVSLRPGATVQMGAPLFAIIEGDNWWVDANFKETDLARIKVDQKATIRLDMYPDVTFDGVVDSISAGSGATFSVLPAENATGNWVKVTQRFPVRIRITNPTQAEHRSLRVGASATVTIDTTQGGK
jgi:membrane fusion protein (multidrug efflux system)